MKTPLADRIRPKTLDEVVGQKHLIGEGKILRNIIENDEVPNMIFYGPSGVGKTTIANIIAQKTGKTLHRLNATTASVADIKNIVSTLDKIGLLQDIPLLARAGLDSSANLIGLALAFKHETNERVYAMAANALAELRTFVEEDDAARVKLKQLSADARPE